jgi:phasin family protein
MADETVVKEAAETIEKVAEAATPVETKPEPKADPAPAKAAAKAPKAKRPAPRKAAAKRVKAARKTAKPVRSAKPKPARKPAASKTATPAKAGRTMIEGVKTMNKQTRDGVDAGLFAAEQFKTVFGDVNERTKAAVERSAKIVEEFADLTRGNVEALVASSKVAAKGVEALSQDAAEYGRKSFEEASAALKSFAEVKSATDFFKLQGDYARAAFDSAVAESARLSETMLKIAGDVAEPLNSRYTVAAERVKTLAA